MEDGSKLASNIKRVNSFVRQLKEENRELREKIEKNLPADMKDTLTYRNMQGEVQEWKRKAESLQALLDEKDTEITILTGKVTELEQKLEEQKQAQPESRIYRVARTHNERGAGRKRKQPAVTTDMIRSMVSEMGAEQAAAELGISKRTLYRRLAEEK